MAELIVWLHRDGKVEPVVADRATDTFVVVNGTKRPTITKLRGYYHRRIDALRQAEIYWEAQFMARASELDAAAQELDDIKNKIVGELSQEAGQKT